MQHKEERHEGKTVYFKLYSITDSMDLKRIQLIKDKNKKNYSPRYSLPVLWFPVLARGHTCLQTLWRHDQAIYVQITEPMRRREWMFRQKLEND